MSRIPHPPGLSFLIVGICLSVTAVLSGCGSSLADVTPPQVEIVSPESGDDITALDTVIVFATDNVGVANVRFFIDNQLLGEVKESPYIFPLQSNYWADDQKHYLTAHAADTSNNIGLSKSIKISIPKIQKPMVQITAPSEFTVSADPKLLIRWSPVPNTVSYSIEVFDDQKSKMPDVSFDTTSLSAVVDLPKDKVFWWRVRPNSVGKAKGEWSPLRTVYRTETCTGMYGTPSHDMFSSLCPSFESGIMVCGSTHDSGGSALLVKYDSVGRFLWKRAFGGSNESWFTQIKQTLDGNYLLAGIKNASETSNDLWCVKVDGDGNMIWEKTFTADSDQSLLGVFELEQGGYLLAGATMQDSDSTSICVYRFREEPFVREPFVFALPSGDIPAAIDLDGNGFVIAGKTTRRSTGTFWSAFVQRVDGAGNELWTTIYSGDGNSEIFSVSSFGGHIYVCGKICNTGTREDGLLAGLDSSGVTLWKKYTGNIGHDSFNALDMSGKVMLVTCGEYSNYGIQSDILISAYSQSGAHLFTKIFGGKYSDVGLSIKKIAADRFGIVGYSNSTTVGGSDGVLILTDSKGELITGPH